jgi:hypothetical protein
MLFTRIHSTLYSTFNWNISLDIISIFWQYAWQFYLTFLMFIVRDCFFFIFICLLSKRKRIEMTITTASAPTTTIEKFFGTMYKIRWMRKMEIHKIDQKVNEYWDKINKCHVRFARACFICYVSLDIHFCVCLYTLFFWPLCMLRKQHHHQENEFKKSSIYAVLWS